MRDDWPLAGVEELARALAAARGSDYFFFMESADNTRQARLEAAARDRYRQRAVELLTTWRMQRRDRELSLDEIERQMESFEPFIEQVAGIFAREDYVPILAAIGRYRQAALALLRRYDAAPIPLDPQATRALHAWWRSWRSQRD